MERLSIAALVIGSVALIVGIMLMVLTVTKLPEWIHRDSEERPPSMSFEPVMLAATQHTDLEKRPWPLVDGVSVQPGDRILLRHQQDARENGLYQVPTQTSSTWYRAPDLKHRRHAMDGKLVWVRQGHLYQGQTFVLKTLNQKGPVGSIDLTFESLSEHLFGMGQEQQVLQVDDRGLARWVSPDITTQRLMSHLVENGRLPSCTLPLHLHFLAEDDVDVLAWREYVGETFQLTIWRRSQWEELVHQHWPEWSEWIEHAPYETMRHHALQWMILFVHGGFMVDPELVPVTDIPLLQMMREWKWPRMVLCTEAILSDHENEALDLQEIRKQVQGHNRQRLSTRWMASCPRHPFIHFVLQHMTHTSEYVKGPGFDVSWATGGDGVGYIYDQYGRDFKDIHLLSCLATEAMIQ